MWENLRVPHKNPCMSGKNGCCSPSIRRNKILAYIVITIFLLMMFTFFIWLKKIVATEQLNYPPTYDCNSLIASFPATEDGAK